MQNEQGKEEFRITAGTVVWALWCLLVFALYVLQFVRK